MSIHIKRDGAMPGENYDKHTCGSDLHIFLCILDHTLCNGKIKYFYLCIECKKTIDMRYLEGCHWH